MGKTLGEKRTGRCCVMGSQTAEQRSLGRRGERRDGSLIRLASILWLLETAEIRFIECREEWQAANRSRLFARPIGAVSSRGQ